MVLDRQLHQRLAEHRLKKFQHNFYLKKTIIYFYVFDMTANTKFRLPQTKKIHLSQKSMVGFIR